VVNQGSARAQRIALLGATGSIGESTLKVLRQHPERFSLHAVAAHANWQAMLPIIEAFRPVVCAMADAESAARLRAALASLPYRVAVESGADAVNACATAGEIDTVVAGISGFAGLPSTWAAVNAGKRVLLANKEALVASGQLLLQRAVETGAQILPIDSEHNAVFQCAAGLLCDPKRVRAITLTASGGPFLSRPLDTFSSITPAEACKHPTWEMGRKISVDSATLMNKGLEVIEAALLFNRSAADVHVVIHPTSTVHALVEFVDRSLLAHLGPADMQVPIAHALGFPERLSLDLPTLSLTALGQLEFYPVDEKRFPALGLAYEALRSGQGACLALNAANEVAVAEFLAGRLTFPAIASLVERTMSALDLSNPATMDDVFVKDQMARDKALTFAKRFEVDREVSVRLKESAE
jgi:1-deoxy-D-xylulose-5-phosphate reductoisomerase